MIDNWRIRFRLSAWVEIKLGDDDMATAERRVGPMPGSEEWRKLRVYDPSGHGVVFGASEAAAALGVSPYCSPLELFLQKTQRIENEVDSDAVEMGHLLEPVVLTLYERRTGRELRRNHPFYWHPAYDFMGCTPDAMTLGDEQIAVDAKTTTWRRYDVADEDKFGEGGDAVPTEYLCQAQQQAAVMGVEQVEFPVLFDGRTLRIYTVHRDEDLIQAIVAAESELAERIRCNDPPEPNWTHPNTSRCLRALHGCNGGVVDLSVESAERWLEIERRKQVIADMERQNDEDRNRILAEMAAAAVAVMPCGTRELKRIVIGESRYTEADVAAVGAKVGEVKRRGYERLSERKVSKR